MQRKNKTTSEWLVLVSRVPAEPTSKRMTICCDWFTTTQAPVLCPIASNFILLASECSNATVLAARRRSHHQGK